MINPKYAMVSTDEAWEMLGEWDELCNSIGSMVDDMSKGEYQTNAFIGGLLDLSNQADTAGTIACAPFFGQRMPIGNGYSNDGVFGTVEVTINNNAEPLVLIIGTDKVPGWEHGVVIWKNDALIEKERLLAEKERERNYTLEGIADNMRARTVKNYSSW